MLGGVTYHHNTHGNPAFCFTRHYFYNVGDFLYLCKLNQCLK
jgi:hypothetical protein